MNGFGSYQMPRLFCDEFDDLKGRWNFKYHLMVYYIKQNLEFQNTNETKIIKELEREDPEIKSSMINTDMRLSLYLNDYKSIFINSTILSIISNFEYELKEILKILKIYKKMSNYSKMDCIISMFCSNRTELENIKNKLSFIIHIRNRITHHSNEFDNYMFNNDKINFFENYCKKDSKRFYFVDYTFCLFIINCIQEFYSLIENNTLCDFKNSRYF